MHPGKKLIFMGAELGQINEWHYESQLDWALLNEPLHAKLKTFFEAANHFYLDTKELWEVDFDWEGFEWIVADDCNNNVVVFLRRDKKGKEVVCAVNFSPVELHHYRFGVPQKKEYVEIFIPMIPRLGAAAQAILRGCERNGFRPTAIPAVWRSRFLPWPAWCCGERDTCVCRRIRPLTRSWSQ